MSVTPKYPGNLEILLAYSPKDKKDKEQLEKHLRSLNYQGVNIYSFTAQELYSKLFRDPLNTAHMIILLISPNFPYSFVEQQLVMSAIRRHNNQEVRVIPIYLRSIDSQGEAYSGLKYLPANGCPVDNRIWKNKDYAFFNIAQDLKEEVERIKIKMPIRQINQVNFGHPQNTQKIEIKENLLILSISKIINKCLIFIRNLRIAIKFTYYECLQKFNNSNVWNSPYKPIRRSGIRRRLRKFSLFISKILIPLILGVGFIQNLSSSEGYSFLYKWIKLNRVSSSIQKQVSDGWIFIGKINQQSSHVFEGDKLISGSQSLNLSVVPKINSKATVRQKVKLRKNMPQAPNFNPQEQDELGVLKSGDKIVILKVRYFVDPNDTPPVTKVWAEVRRY